MLDLYWYVACESRELTRGPLAREIFGKPIVFFRDERGVACAIEDRCAHRNFPLSAGRVESGRLRCAYHGWCFNGRGEACAIPSLPAPPEGAVVSVERYECLERDGYVWIVPGGKPIHTAPHTFLHLGASGYQSFRLKTRFAGGVEICLENFLDCPHAAFVHAGLFRTHSPRTINAKVRQQVDGAEVEYFGESREGGLVWRLLSRKKTALRHVDRFIRPATSQVEYEFSDGRRYVITSMCTPVTECVTDVYTVISFRFGFCGALIKPIFKFLSQRIIAQDVAAVRRQGWNIARFGNTPKFRLVASDLLLPHILQWRNALRDGREAPLRQNLSERDVSICI